MSQEEMSPQDIGTADTLKAPEPEEHMVANQEEVPSPGELAEQMQMAEAVKSQFKELSENPILTSAADKFIEIMDSTLMVPVRKTWDAVPKQGQDAFLASRYIPNPLISMYPHLVKLMTDVGFLDRKGNSEEEIAEAAENEAKLDAFIAEMAGLIPQTEEFKPLIDKVIEGKQMFNAWIKDRRVELHKRRAEKEDSDKLAEIRGNISQ